jgi:hypothetical protein
MLQWTTQVRARRVELFGIDLRALAALRIVLALLLLVDIVSRSFLLAANYTDSGAHPRAAALEYYATRELPSLYMYGGSTLYVAALFTLAGAAALALALGWRTRLATLASWLLADSLVARHDLVTDGGDYLLCVLLFWGVFAPLGARWSLDARRSSASVSSPACTPATAALLLQVGCVFLVTGITKSGPEWLDGTAIQYALDRRWWVRPFGEWVLAHPPVAHLLTPAVRWYEILGALALFVPIYTAPLRCLAVLGFWGLLAGLGLGLRLNLFPFITGASLLVFLPAFVWDRLEARFPRLRANTTAAAPRLHPARWLVHAAVLLLLGIAMWLAAAQVSHALAPPRALARIGRFLHLRQGWLMYAPSPRHIDIELEHRGQLADRSLLRLDDAEGGPSWRTVRAAWTDYRFQYYLQKLVNPQWEGSAAAYARWLCRQWNADHAGDDRLESITVSAVARPITLPGEPERTRTSRRLAAADCGPER